MLLGVDLGTSYLKAGLFDRDGTLRGLGRVAVAAETDGAGRVELPVPLFWRRLRQAVEEARVAAGVNANAIEGVSYSSQANTFVLLDGADAPLTPLVFWNDTRARPLEPELAEFGATPGHAAATGFTQASADRAPAKWRWFAREHPGVWRRVRRALTIADYFTFALTGEPAGDASTAALTGLYDFRARDWWSPALARFGVDRAQLSRLLAPGTPCGRTTARATELLGLPAGVPFAVGALDHHAAAIGSGIGTAVDASLSAGTVLAALVLVDGVTPEPGCIHGPHTDGRRCYRLAFDPAGAGQLEDYQRRAAPGIGVADLLALAERGDPGHGAAVRALLGRIATSQGELLRRAAAGRAVGRAAATGGGARNPFWTQLTADVLGIPLVTGAAPEPACLGAAQFAAVAAEIYRDHAAAARGMMPATREFTPRRGLVE